MKKKKVIILTGILLIIIILAIVITMYLMKRAKYIYDVEKVSEINYNIINIDKK